MPKDLKTQYRKLQNQIARIGWIAQGSAYPRHFTIKVGGKPKRCGPYYCLTWKEANKTQTKALSAQQYKLFSEAIANQRKIEKILANMRRISIKFIHETTEDLPKRVRLKLT